MFGICLFGTKLLIWPMLLLWLHEKHVGKLPLDFTGTKLHKGQFSCLFMSWCLHHNFGHLVSIIATLVPVACVLEQFLGSLGVIILFVFNSIFGTVAAWYWQLMHARTESNILICNETESRGASIGVFSFLSLACFVCPHIYIIEYLKSSLLVLLILLLSLFMVAIVFCKYCSHLLLFVYGAIGIILCMIIYFFLDLHINDVNYDISVGTFVALCYIISILNKTFDERETHRINYLGHFVGSLLGCIEGLPFFMSYCNFLANFNLSWIRLCSCLFGPLVAIVGAIYYFLIFEDCLSYIKFIYYLCFAFLCCLCIFVYCFVVWYIFYKFCMYYLN